MAERSPALAMLLDPGSPRETRLLAARGMFPVTPAELIELQVTFSADADAELAEAARTSLAEADPAIVGAWASELATAESLDQLARACDTPPVIELILRSRLTSDATLAELAERLPPDLQDVLAVNQDRLVRSPAIFAAFRRNPRLTGDSRRRLHELEHEFFTKSGAAKSFTASSADAAALPVDELFAPIGEAGAPGEAAPGEALFEEIELPEEMVVEEELDEARRISVHTQLSLMSVSQRVQAGHKGNKEVRSILIRDTNRLVAMAAAQSPRLTPQEVEGMAALRSVNEDVLRHFATNREWSSKYAIAKALVRNPRSPTDAVLGFVIRLNQRDIKELSRDKGVAEVIRSTALRIYRQKYQQ